MPEPRENETEEEFVERCIPVVLDDDTAEDSDQAVAVCHSLWEEHHEGGGDGKSMDDEKQKDEGGKKLDADSTLVVYGSEVKALGDGKVGGLLVRFTSADEPDLAGDYFDAKTDFGPAETSAVYYIHGMDRTLRRRRLAGGHPAPLSLKDAGVWIEAQLDMRDAYEQAIYKLAEAGKLGWSSGTAAHLVEREEVDEGKAYHITSWPLGLDASLTPTPADPGNQAVPLKSLALSEASTLDLDAETDAGVKATVQKEKEGNVTVNIHVNPGGHTEEQDDSQEATMSEDTKNVQDAAQETPTVDVASIAKEAAAEAAKAAAQDAVKAYREALENEPGTDKAKVLVTDDESDRALEGNPYKSLGELLTDVTRVGAHGPLPKRLAPLKSTDPIDENGFDVGRALGDAWVGSVYRKAMSPAVKQSGLNETTPSAGGYLVDTDRQEGILARTYDVGELLRRIAVYQVSANSNGMTFYAEDETSRADGSRRGGIRAYWTAEASDKTSSEPKFREMELKLRKVAALVYATDELLADASALESYIMRNLPEELRFVVEDAIINGSGAGQPLGILNANCLVSVPKETGQAATTVVSENIMNMWARMWAPSRRNAVWLINQDVEPELYNMDLAVGTGGMPTFLPPGGLSQSPYSSLMGRDVIPCEYMPTLGTVGDIVLADLSQYIGIEKGGVESASSIHVRFVYDETAFRFVYRFDGQCAWSAALTPFQGSNTVSPFIALATRS